MKTLDVLRTRDAVMVGGMTASHFAAGDQVGIAYDGPLITITHKKSGMTALVPWTNVLWATPTPEKKAKVEK